MAVQQIVPIFVTLQGDASATTFTFALKNMYQAGLGGSQPASGGFAVVPTSIAVTNPPVPVTSATVDANGNITITFTSALPASTFSFEIDLIFASGGATSSSSIQSQNVTLVGTATANITQVAGSTISATNTLFDQITDGTNAMGTMTNFGTGPGTVKALNTNTSIFSGTTALTNTGGALNINVSSGSANPAASSVSTAIPSSASLTGINVSGTLRPWTGVNPTGSVYAGQTDVSSYAGTILTGTVTAYGTAPTGNVYGVNTFVTNTPSVNQGTSPWVTQDKGTQAITSSVGTAVAFATGVAGLYNTTQPAPTNGQAVEFQTDQSGNLLTYPGVQTKTGAVWTSATTINTLQYPTGTTTAGAPIGASALLVQLDQTTTVTGGAVTIQGTYDGTNWVTIPTAQLLNPNTFATLTNPYTFVASTNQPFLILTQGYQNIRLNLTTLFTGTGSVSPFWTVLPYSITTPSSASSTVNMTQVASVTLGASSVVAYGSTPAASNVQATNAFVTNTIASNISQVGGATQSATNPLFTRITDGTTAITAAVSAYGTAPTGTSVMGVNSFVTNTVTVSGTVSITANSSVNVNQIGGSAVSTAASGVQKVGIVGNAGATLDSASGATAPTNSVSVSGTYNTTLPTLLNGQAGTFQLDAKGQQLVDLNYYAGSALGAPAAYGTSPGAVNVIGANAFVTNTVAENITQVAGSSVSTAATGVMKVGIVGSAGATVDFAASQNQTPSTNMVLIGSEYNTAPTAITSGNGSPIQSDTVGSLFVNSEGRKASYRVGVVGATPIASATAPSWSMTGSATKTIRVTKLRFTATAATGATINAQLNRFSALSGGTSASQASNVAKLDVNDAAQTAVVNTWSVAAGTLTSAGILAAERYEIVTASVSVLPGSVEWDFGDKNARGLVLRGTSDFIGIILSAVGTTPVWSVWVEWTEET